MAIIRLFLLATIAVLSVFFMNSSNVVTADILQDIRDLPPPFRNRNITAEEVIRIFREKCKKATGIYNSTHFQEVEKGAAKMMGCFSTITNLTSLKEEIEVARPIGELDTVFHKHCLKAPIAKTCFRDFNKLLQPCLSKKEKGQNAVMERVVLGLVDFMCARGGDQIAVFVAEDGPECLEANQDVIAQCANQSFSEFKPRNSITDLFNLPDFVLEPEHCVDLAKFETCTLHYLERCREITPVNVAGAVFKYIKKETTCTDYLEGRTKPRSILKDPNENDGAATMSISLMVALCSLSVKYLL